MNICSFVLYSFAVVHLVYLSSAPFQTSLGPQQNPFYYFCIETVFTLPNLTGNVQNVEKYD